MPFETDTDYRARFEIDDAAGNPLPIAGADVIFRHTRRLAGEQTLTELTDNDARLTVEPNGQTGVVSVLVPASEITYSGTVFEELRIDTGSISTVPVQRSVNFRATATEA